MIYIYIYYILLFIFVQYGDIREDLTQEEWAIERLLPQRVIDQFQMTADMWIDKVKPYYNDHQGMHRYEL